MKHSNYNMMGTPTHNSIDIPRNQDAANLMDSLSIMIEQESTTYICGDYLNSDSSCAKRCDIDEEVESAVYRITADDRMQIVDWCYQIIDQCKFKRETVAVAMNLADRFMCTPEAQDILHHRGRYQLVAVTALYISIKLNEPLAFGSKDFAALSNGTYSVKDIEEMEWTMLQGLSWRTCPPTSLQVAHHILALMLCHLREKKTPLQQGTWDFVHEEVAYQVENSIREYYFTTRRPSTIATAAILNAIEQVDDRDYTILILALVPILHEFDFDSPHQIREAMGRLHSIVNESSEEECTECPPEVNPRTSNKPFNKSSQTRSVSPERREESRVEENLEVESESKSWTRDSYNDVCADIYQEISIAAADDSQL